MAINSEPGAGRVEVFEIGVNFKLRKNGRIWVKPVINTGSISRPCKNCFLKSVVYR